MANLTVSSVRVPGLAAAVPSQTATWRDNIDRFGEEAARTICKKTGVERRHIAPPGVCSSDLCAAAAERLLDELNWSPSCVDLLIFVSQTPDYLIPATSCTMQARLGLGSNCAAFDINLGCSGYVYGLGVAGQMVSGGSIRRALLLVGDTISKIVANDDRSTAPLFGDAGSATALEFDPEAADIEFVLGTDGRGAENLIVPASGFRHPRKNDTAVPRERGNGYLGSDEYLFMDGAEIFAFTLREVPRLIRSGLAAANWTMEDTDAIVMHQANGFMLNHLGKRLQIPREKLVLALDEFGNTSCASIPLAISAKLADQVSVTERSLLLAGFGVGYSWATAALTLGPCVIPDLVTVEAPAANPEADAA